MHIIILKDHLIESIQHVLKAVSNKTSIPILQGIKLEMNDSGLTLSASDAEISIQSFIPIRLNEETIIQIKMLGSVVLPAKFFSEIARKLPANTVEIEVKEHFQTILRSGSSEIQIMGLDAEEFPLLPEVDHTQKITIPSELLKNMIRQTVFAVSTNESTPVLTGVLWSVTEDIIKFSACDRHRLASSEIQFDESTNQSFDHIVISGKTLNDLHKLLPEQNTLIDIFISENQVLFQLHSILFYTRLLDGTYPDTSKLIPQTFKTELVVETKKLADSIDRAYLLSKEDKTNIVRLHMMDEQTIEISSSSSEIGKVTEQIVTDEITGELLKLAFNSRFMLDALKAIDSDKVHIGFTGAMHPIIIKPLDSDHTLQLILPYRTTN